MTSLRIQDGTREGPSSGNKLFKIFELDFFPNSQYPEIAAVESHQNYSMKVRIKEKLGASQPLNKFLKQDEKEVTHENEYEKENSASELEKVSLSNDEEKHTEANES
ncbi:hypothetical protein RYX36_008597 [Vicia faba]